MLPILFKIEEIVFYSYSFMRFIGILLAVAFAVYRTNKKGIKPSYVVTVIFIFSLLSFLGSHLFYIVFHTSKNEFSLVQMVNVLSIKSPGYASVGAFLFGFLITFIFIKITKHSILEIMNLLTPSGLIFIIFAKAGCFLGGCCFGTPTNLPVGLKFPEISPAGSIYPNISIHPTQLYYVFLCLMLFFFLLIIERFEGYDDLVFFLFLFFYGIFRYIIEFYQFIDLAMVVDLHIFTLTINQILGLLISLSGLLGIIIKGKLHQPFKFMPLNF